MTASARGAHIDIRYLKDAKHRLADIIFAIERILDIQRVHFRPPPRTAAAAAACERMSKATNEINTSAAVCFCFLVLSWQIIGVSSVNGRSKRRRQCPPHQPVAAPVAAAAAAAAAALLLGEAAW